MYNIKINDDEPDIEVEGVRQEIVSLWRLPRRLKKKTEFDACNDMNESFRLADAESATEDEAAQTDGSGYTEPSKSYRYAYHNYDKDAKRDFYHVVTIRDPDDPGVLNYLEYCDDQERSITRRASEKESYKEQNYLNAKEADDDDDSRDPMEMELYRVWKRDEKTSRTKPFPIDAREGIIQTIVDQLPPAERGVFGLLFDSHISEADIRKELNIEANTWGNRKARLLKDVGRVFAALGYDVPEPEDKRGRKSASESVPENDSDEEDTGSTARDGEPEDDWSEADELALRQSMADERRR